MFCGIGKSVCLADIVAVCSVYDIFIPDQKGITAAVVYQVFF